MPDYTVAVTLTDEQATAVTWHQEDADDTRPLEEVFAGVIIAWSERWIGRLESKERSAIEQVTRDISVEELKDILKDKMPPGKDKGQEKVRT